MIRLTLEEGRALGLRADPKAREVDATAQEGRNFRWWADVREWRSLPEDEERTRPVQICSDCGLDALGEGHASGCPNPVIRICPKCGLDMNHAAHRDGCPKIPVVPSPHSHEWEYSNSHGDLWTCACGSTSETKPRDWFPEPTDDDLIAWWMSKSASDAQATIPKAREYGSDSMVDAGRIFGKVAGRELDEQHSLEWAIFQYMEGKMGRWRSAMIRGEDVSDDTIFDMSVYLMMLRRVRETGRWT